MTKQGKPLVLLAAFLFNEITWYSRGMFSAPFFGVVSSLFILVGAIPYIKDIFKKQVHPHVLSWLGWGLITGLGAAAMYADGSTWMAVIVFANTIACLSIAFFAAVRKVGVWETSGFDWFFFFMGLLGVVLWQTLDMPILALICAMVADFAFGIPTIIKTYLNPETETLFVWVAATLSGFFSLFAIQTIAFHEIAYPVYLLFFDSTVLLLVLKIVKKKKAGA